VLGTVLRDDRGASSHQFVSRVVLVRTPRVLNFLFFLLGFIWELCCPFHDWIKQGSLRPEHYVFLLLISLPTNKKRTLKVLCMFSRRCRCCIYLLFWTILSCIYIYYYFIHSMWFIYLFHIAFRTHVSLCVRGRVITPNSDLLFWDVTMCILNLPSYCSPKLVRQESYITAMDLCMPGMSLGQLTWYICLICSNNYASELIWSELKSDY
jgi:hypothetical protein